MTVEWMEKRANRGHLTIRATVYNKSDCTILRLNSRLVEKYRLQDWMRVFIGYDKQARRVYLRSTNDAKGLLFGVPLKNNNARQVSLRGAIQYLGMELVRNYSAEYSESDNILILIPQE